MSRLCRIQLPDGTIHHAVDEGGAFALLGGPPLAGGERTGEVVADGKLLAPFVPHTIFAIGLNFRDHATEMRKPIPDHPVVTMKNPASLLDPGASILLPRHLRSDAVDFECELAVVIGRECKNAHPGNALDFVFGYTVANDVSARDWQNIHGGGQWCKGKSFDTFCPLGPWLVTRDALPDPGKLGMITRLNGEVMQESNTSEMIFPVAELIVFLSGSTTLLPGTLILTGTPAGVGTGRTPPRFLQAGDHIEVAVDGIGSLANPVAEETVA